MVGNYTRANPPSSGGKHNQGLAAMTKRLTIMDLLSGKEIMSSEQTWNQQGYEHQDLRYEFLLGSNKEQHGLHQHRRRSLLSIKIIEIGRTKTNSRFESRGHQIHDGI